ncbi:hypothetical protein DYH09_01750 [bacterium CPR1]|nr:hypothetical protein [bacterium CPR1]
MDELSGKAKDTLMKGWGFLKNRAKETMDVTKTAGQLREQQKRHSELISDLGHRVYAMVQSDKIDLDSLRERCAAIEALEKEIEQLQSELGEKKAEIKEHLGDAVPKRRTCPRCNAPLGLLDQDCPRCAPAPE